MKDEDSVVVGTIKVKNVSFEKEVVVRVTFDDWKSQQDIFCNFSRVSLMDLVLGALFSFCLFVLDLQSSWNSNSGPHSL